MSLAIINPDESTGMAYSYDTIGNTDTISAENYEPIDYTYTSYDGNKIWK